MGNDKIYRHKKPFIIWVIFISLSINIALSQGKWIKVDTPNQNLNPFFEYGENYYIMPQDLFRKDASKKEDVMTEISLPNEIGEEEIFQIEAVPLFSEKLSKEYPAIKTFKGKSKVRKDVEVRLSTQQGGINAWIHLKSSPDLFFQPVKGNKNLHYSYLKRKEFNSSNLFCKTEVQKEKKKSTSVKLYNKSFRQKIRTFRIAIATTAEYTNYWGDNNQSNGSNKEDALAAIASTLNRINSIFERDLNIRLELVSDDSLIYEDTDQDPFTGNFGSELQRTLDDVLGDENYDIGHLFDYGEPNGDAGCIGCVCLKGKKGKGFSTHPFRDTYGGEYRNDYFDLDYAGHEIGHQFGAYHTYSFETEGTGFNAEPGSGSTIMGYAGITGPDDLQQHGDPYFHYYSIQNILNYVESINCGTNESLSSEILNIDAGQNYTIPVGTPYELKVDLSPNLEVENYTYCWEQLDSAEITSSNFGPYNPIGSMARSLPPNISPKRKIPNLKRILDSELTEQNPSIGDDWETTPLIGRKMQWGLTVRKQTPTLSLVAQDSIEITSYANAGPFKINSQNELGLSLKGGSLENILWDVAKTDQNPIDASHVNITLSTDGGESFPIELANGIINDGFSRVIIPNEINTDQARLMIKPTNNIFFAINSSDFKIESRDLILNLDTFIKENCGSDVQLFTFEIKKYNNFKEPFTLQLNPKLPNIDIKFSKPVFVENDSLGYFEFSGLNALETGDYDFTLEAQFSSGSEQFPFILEQRNDEIENADILAPENNSNNVSLNPILSWMSDSNIDNSRIQIAIDQDFQSLVIDTTLASSQFQLSKLQPSTKYFWRIQSQNNCEIGDFSEVFTFQTNSISCEDINSDDLPNDLEDATEEKDGETLSSIEVDFNSTIIDLDVLVDLEHSYTDDLTLYLETPSGERILLSRALGDSGDNYTQTIFDQEANLNISQSQPPFTGSFVPLQDLSILYGTSSYGTWKLIVLDQYKEDTGTLLKFQLNLCVEGNIENNSDNDSFSDNQDNCPFVTNEDQSDIDNNGVGDICDLFSTQNISIIKNDATCPDQDNGTLFFNARADFTYTTEINGPNDFYKTFDFSILGEVLENLKPGSYNVCIRVNNYPDFQYCYETQINAPEKLSVQAEYNPFLSVLNIDLSGGKYYDIMLNDKSYKVSNQNNIQLPVNEKINRIEIRTDKDCQGIFEEWLNLTEKARVYPNPVSDLIKIVLPKDSAPDIYLFSGNGDLFWSKKSANGFYGLVEIPMQFLPAGIYILKIDYNGHIENHKLIKK